MGGGRSLRRDLGAGPPAAPPHARRVPRPPRVAHQGLGVAAHHPQRHRVALGRLAGARRKRPVRSRGRACGQRALCARGQRVRPRPRGSVHRRPGARLHGVPPACGAPVVLLTGRRRPQEGLRAHEAQHRVRGPVPVGRGALQGRLARGHEREPPLLGRHALGAERGARAHPHPGHGGGARPRHRGVQGLGGLPRAPRPGRGLLRHRRGGRLEDAGRAGAPAGPGRALHHHLRGAQALPRGRPHPAQHHRHAEARKRAARHGARRRGPRPAGTLREEALHLPAHRLQVRELRGRRRPRGARGLRGRRGPRGPGHGEGLPYDAPRRLQGGGRRQGGGPRGAPPHPPAHGRPACGALRGGGRGGAPSVRVAAGRRGARPRVYAHGGERRLQRPALHGHRLHRHRSRLEAAASRQAGSRGRARRRRRG